MKKTKTEARENPRSGIQEAEGMCNNIKDHRIQITKGGGLTWVYRLDQWETGEMSLDHKLHLFKENTITHTMYEVDN